MTKTFAAALFAMLVAFIALQAVPPAAADPVPASFDIAMPAPQAPFDTTPITAVETVGASPTE